MPAQDNPQNSPNLADIWLCASHATVFSGCVTCKTHCPERCAPGRMQTLSASDVARRLEEVQSFVRAQQGLPLGEDFLQTLVSGQVTSMVRLFKQIQSPSLEDVTRLVNLLQTGPWSDEDTQTMVLAVSQMVGTSRKAIQHSIAELPSPACIHDTVGVVSLEGPEPIPHLPRPSGCIPHGPPWLSEAERADS